MSSGAACKCGHARGARPLFWRVVQRLENHSAFNGYHATPSRYSEIRCTVCRARWRTRAAYVASLPDEVTPP